MQSNEMSLTQVNGIFFKADSVNRNDLSVQCQATSIAGL